MTSNLMVIFGAGASHDSVSDAAIPRVVDSAVLREHQPPLADHLFDARRLFGEVIDRYPACRPLVGELRSAISGGRTSLEAVLEVVQEEAQQHPHLFRQLTALRFYLQDVLWECGKKWFDSAYGVTNHATLLSRIETWREAHGTAVALVTFNYDLLLEWGCHDALGWSFPDLDAYVGRNDWRLFKLHGSVKWGHPVKTDDGRGHIIHEDPTAMIVRAPELELDPEIWQAETLEDARRSGLYPAIAIPVEAKSVFECPPEHLTALENLLSETELLLVIGWRGAEDHFLRLWDGRVRPDQRLHVVTNSEEGCEEVVARLQSHGLGAGGATFSASGFSGFVDSGDCLSFLS